MHISSYNSLLNDYWFTSATACALLATKGFVYQSSAGNSKDNVGLENKPSSIYQMWLIMIIRQGTFGPPLSVLFSLFACDIHKEHTSVYDLCRPSSFAVSNGGFNIDAGVQGTEMHSWLKHLQHCPIANSWVGSCFLVKKKKKILRRAVSDGTNKRTTVRLVWAGALTKAERTENWAPSAQAHTWSTEKHYSLRGRRKTSCLLV